MSAAGLCLVCGRRHTPGDGHIAWSRQYQRQFRELHGRPAIWADAIAHCDRRTIRCYRIVFERHGISLTAPREGLPIAQEPRYAAPAAAETVLG